MRVRVPREGIILVSGRTGPVWRDADGNQYNSWDELGLDHLKNVVALLTKRAEEAQKEFKRLKQRKADQAELTYTYYAEENWRELLLVLEGASRALKRRLDSDNAFELDPAPLTPQEALTRAGSVLGEAPRRADKQRGSPVSPAREGKIVERPRKLRIEENSNQKEGET